MSIILKVMAAAAAVVLTLSACSSISQTDAYFFLLFPGIATQLRLTGGHGGTHSQEAIAALAGFLVNTLVYATVFFLGIAVKKAITGRNVPRPTN
jgi:hypothetical protein